MLVLTDHRTHSASNSLYGLVRELRAHPMCRYIDIASKGNPENAAFFDGRPDAPLYGSRIDPSFAFSTSGGPFQLPLHPLPIRAYDSILLRLPPPVSPNFWAYLQTRVDEHKCINRPSGMLKTGSKAYLIEVAALCPPIRLLRSKADIRDFLAQHPIVLKPLNDYGGKGMIRLEGNRAWRGNQELPLAQFFEQLDDDDIHYLGMEFQQRVAEGDKRIIVAGNEVLGAVLRLPPPDSWLCNTAQGGQAMAAEVSPEEHDIARQLIGQLSREGIVLFGFDTLMGKDGKRRLSEINTTSIGGIVPLAELHQQPLVERAADQVWNYVNQKIYGSSLSAH